MPINAQIKYSAFFKSIILLSNETVHERNQDAERVAVVKARRPGPQGPRASQRRKTLAIKIQHREKRCGKGAAGEFSPSLEGAGAGGCTAAEAGIAMPTTRTATAARPTEVHAAAISLLL
jgi:hypothetical protein